MVQEKISPLLPEFLASMYRKRNILLSAVMVEIGNRYSGSIIGRLWIVLYPVLLLCIYIFVYMVIFRVRFPGYSQLDYVLYVFSGLVPYICFMEALSFGSACLKQNMHLVRNVIVPAQFLPVRVVAIGLIAQVPGILLILVLTAADASLTWNVFLLPAVILLQAMFLIGLAWILAPIGLVVPDLNNVIALFVLFLLFISPIAFRPDMVPDNFQFIIFLNPIYYLAEAYRITLLGFPLDMVKIGIFAGLSVVSFVAGGILFSRFQDVLADYE